MLLRCLTIECVYTCRRRYSGYALFDLRDTGMAYHSAAAAGGLLLLRTASVGLIMLVRWVEVLIPIVRLQAVTKSLDAQTCT